MSNISVLSSPLWRVGAFGWYLENGLGITDPQVWREELLSYVYWACSLSFPLWNSDSRCSWTLAASGSLFSSFELPIAPTTLPKEYDTCCRLLQRSEGLWNTEHRTFGKVEEVWSFPGLAAAPKSHNNHSAVPSSKFTLSILLLTEIDGSLIICKKNWNDLFKTAAVIIQAKNRSRFQSTLFFAKC